MPKPDELRTRQDLTMTESHSMTFAPQPAATDLRSVPFPEAFREGAHNAATTCLRIAPEERVTLITDETTAPVAASIAAELERIGCVWHGFVLEELAARPLKEMPPEVLDDMERAQVSIFAVQVQPNELRSRMQMTDVVNRRKMRHAHMVNITPEIMLGGMRADFNAVDRLSQAVLDRVRQAKYVRATTPAGTNIFAELDPEYRWFKTSGIISPEKWGNLPGGEVFTAPGEINGVFVGALRDSAGNAADHSHQPQSDHLGRVCEQGPGAGVLGVHAYGCKLRPGRRVCDRDQHRGAGGDRKHPAG